MQTDEEKHFTPWQKYYDHCAIKFCMTMKAFEQKQASEKIKVWNFNDPEGWEKFSKLTEPSTVLSNMWQVGPHTEISYQKWQNNLNRILHLCFKKKRIRCMKSIYNKEIRQLIKERKQWKTPLCNKPPESLAPSIFQTPKKFCMSLLFTFFPASLIFKCPSCIILSCPT